MNPSKAAAALRTESGGSSLFAKRVCVYWPIDNEREATRLPSWGSLNKTAFATSPFCRFALCPYAVCSDCQMIARYAIGSLVCPLDVTTVTLVYFYSCVSTAFTLHDHVMFSMCFRVRGASPSLVLCSMYPSSHDNPSTTPLGQTDLTTAMHAFLCFVPAHILAPLAFIAHSTL